MAIDKAVDSTQLNTDLTSVANAIRAKTGGSSQLAFPADFVSEIEGIIGGMTVTETPDVGGGTIIAIDANIDIILEPITITENGVVTAPSGKAFNQITTNVSGVPEVTISTSGDVVATLDPNKAYHFVSNAITSLTISFSGTQAEQYHFDFISPATAVQLTLPSFVTMEQYFSVEANTKLEIDIANGYGVCAEWAYEVT